MKLIKNNFLIQNDDFIVLQYNLLQRSLKNLWWTIAQNNGHVHNIGGGSVAKPWTAKLEY
jgi:hypothetical protein